MTTNFKFLIVLVSLTLSACGASVDMSSLVARIDRLETSNRTLETRNAQLTADNNALIEGRAPSAETHPATVATATPVAVSAPSSAPYVGINVAPANNSGALQMCDGIDGVGMITSRRLSPTMAYTSGTEQWSRSDLDGMTLTFPNVSIFDIAIAIDGQVVHTFSGHTPLMVSDTRGMCAMPAIPRRLNAVSSTTVTVPLVGRSAERNEHTITYICYRAAGGRIATAPAYTGSFTMSMAGTREMQLTNTMCGQPGTI